MRRRLHSMPSLKAQSHRLLNQSLQLNLLYLPCQTSMSWQKLTNDSGKVRQGHLLKNLQMPNR